MAIDDILTRIKNRFTTPYYTETGGNLDKLLQVFVTPIDELSETSDDVVAAHQLSEATGGSLDKWGNLLRLARNTGEADALYRARLFTHSLIRRRSATSQDMVSTCAGVLGVATNRIEFVDGATPASFRLNTFIIDITNAGITLSNFRDMMDAAKAGGVGMTINILGSFTCRGIGDADDDTKGYNNIADGNSDGGRYSGAI